jgi:hypothetical protein
MTIRSAETISYWFTEANRKTVMSIISVMSQISIILLYRARICERLRSLGIDSDKLIPPAYVAWRQVQQIGCCVPALQAGNRFLVSLKGCQIQTISTCDFYFILKTTCAEHESTERWSASPSRPLATSFPTASRGGPTSS